MVRIPMPRAAWVKPAVNQSRQGNWRAAWARGKAQKRIVQCALLGMHKPDLPVTVVMTRESAGQLDTDNLAGAFKHVRDAIADWLGCGDSPSDPVIWRCEQRRGKRGHQYIEIEWENG